MLNEVKINGRSRLFRHITYVEKVRRGNFIVGTHCRGMFLVEGGRSAGGKRSDWFLCHKDWDKPIYCSSLVDACNVIEGM